MYIFLSQSAMLFGGYIQSRITNIEGAKTYVRIIKDVEAARIAKFPVNFTSNVGYIRRKAKGACTDRIKYIQCLIHRPLALQERDSELERLPGSRFCSPK